MGNSIWRQKGGMSLSRIVTAALGCLETCRKIEGVGAVGVLHHVQLNLAHTLERADRERICREQLVRRRILGMAFAEAWIALQQLHCLFPGKTQAPSPAPALGFALPSPLASSGTGLLWVGERSFSPAKPQSESAPPTPSYSFSSADAIHPSPTARPSSRASSRMFRLRGRLARRIGT